MVRQPAGQRRGAEADAEDALRRRRLQPAEGQRRRRHHAQVLEGQRDRAVLDVRDALLDLVEFEAAPRAARDDGDDAVAVGRARGVHDFGRTADVGRRKRGLRGRIGDGARPLARAPPPRRGRPSEAARVANLELRANLRQNFPSSIARVDGIARVSHAAWRTLAVDALRLRECVWQLQRERCGEHGQHFDVRRDLVARARRDRGHCRVPPIVGAPTPPSASRANFLSQICTPWATLHLPKTLASRRSPRSRAPCST